MRSRKEGKRPPQAWLATTPTKSFLVVKGGVGAPLATPEIPALPSSGLTNCKLTVLGYNRWSQFSLSTFQTTAFVKVGYLPHLFWLKASVLHRSIISHTHATCFAHYLSAVSSVVLGPAALAFPGRSIRTTDSGYPDPSEPACLMRSPGSDLCYINISKAVLFHLILRANLGGTYHY